MVSGPCSAFSIRLKYRRTLLPAPGHVSNDNATTTNATSPAQMVTTAARLRRRFRRHQYQKALLYMDIYRHSTGRRRMSRRVVSSSVSGSGLHRVDRPVPAQMPVLEAIGRIAGEQVEIVGGRLQALAHHSR